MVIVAAIDRSDSATRVVDEANKLAEVFGDEVHVLHVLNESDFVEIETTSVEDTGRPVEMDQIREMAAEIAEQRAENIDSAVPIGKIGQASTEIVNYGIETDARYIVIGGRKRSPTGKVLFGSVTQSVLLNADKPVLVVMDKE